MMKFDSFILEVADNDASLNTINEYYDFLEEKEEEYCKQTDDTLLGYRRDRDIEKLKNEKFSIYVPISTEIREVINWESVIKLFNGPLWTVEGESLEELINHLRSQITDDELRCFAEVGVIGICEFALKNGYTIHATER